MKIASKPRNIVYIPRLTDETTVEYKIDEYMSLYKIDEYETIFLGYV
jgi:hypothetical protein